MGFLYDLVPPEKVEKSKTNSLKREGSNRMAALPSFFSLG